MRVSVVGSGGEIDDRLRERAQEVGRELGRRGHALVCGGLDGVMEAACRGANDAGGDTVGVLPGEDSDAANPYVDVAVATGLGEMRNALVVMNGDVVVALEGGYGTLSEVALALKRDAPVVSFGGPDVDGVVEAESPGDAVDVAEELMDVS